MIIIVNIADKIHSNIVQIILTIISFFIIFKTIFYYKRFQGIKQEKKNKNIEKAIQYLINSLSLYDEDIFEIGNEKEKRIIRTIKIFYREDDKKVY